MANEIAIMARYAPPPGLASLDHPPPAQVGCIRLGPLLKCRTRASPSSGGGGIELDGCNSIGQNHCAELLAMAGLKRVHDRAILDALDAIDPTPFEGRVWSVTPKDREALRGSGTHGRWSPNGEFEVLYTSLERAGALTEIGHRLSLEPVWPSRLQHEIHRIEVRTERTLHI